MATTPYLQKSDHSSCVGNLPDQNDSTNKQLTNKHI